MYQIKKGLDLPISGSASGAIQSILTQRVGILGQEYLGMKPTMLVKEGDWVAKGQKLFEDKKNPGVFFTAPIAGQIQAIHRGEQRALLSVIIERQGEEKIQFQSYPESELSHLSREQIVSALTESGLWTALRTRPFSKIPAPTATPYALFVNAMDSNPLAIDPTSVIEAASAGFMAGLRVVSQLTTGKTYVCKRAGTAVATGDANVEVAEFAGPHPAGLVGTHIHFLAPVNAHKTVWHLNYQDVIAIGQLFLTGELDSSRTISIAGPAAQSPMWVKTESGADLSELLATQKVDAQTRVINGSVLSGLSTCEKTAYLGKYALQVSLLKEGTNKEFIGWLKPGSDKFSATKTYLGGVLNKLFPMTTSTGGSPRCLVPIDVYEKVMPLNILPMLLFKAIIMKDTDEAQRLGVLELDEEDLALSTFVCPSKYEYGAILRDNLEQIEKDG